MTPAEELRAAATLLRETASKATPGAREVAHLAGIGTCVRNPDLSFCVTVEHGWVQEGDAEWIALMSPALAEPLADWLDAVATDVEISEADRAAGWAAFISPMHPALAVARAITGSTR